MNVLQSGWRRFLPRTVTVIGIMAISLGATSKSCQILTEDVEPSFRTELEIQNAAGEADNIFRRNDEITFVLTVTNQLDTTSRIRFDTGRQFDFVVLEPGTDEIVWQWSEDPQTGNLGTERSELVFSPRQERRFTRTWNQIKANGAAIDPGTYEARGVLVFDQFDEDPRADNQQGSEFESLTIE